MTLRELCEKTGVSRRAIQGYEKAGLVSASKKNNRGYLIYDLDSEVLIMKIKFFQEIGFTIKEMKSIMTMPNSDLKNILLEQISKLEEKQLQIDALISKTYNYIDTL